MADRPGARPQPVAGVPHHVPTPPGWQGPPPVRTPSGLFPSGPPRPTYREPHPVRLGPLATGAGVAAAWLLLFGLLGRDLSGYAWWTALAATVAWLVALVLLRRGDRGAAAGIAMVTAVAVGIAAVAVAVRWAGTADWPLW
jgi:hypothetical protein